MLQSEAVKQVEAGSSGSFPTRVCMEINRKPLLQVASPASPPLADREVWHLSFVAVGPGARYVGQWRSLALFQSHAPTPKNINGGCRKVVVQVWLSNPP